MGAQAGSIYQTHAARHGDDGDVCIGADCFRLTFLVAAALEVVAALLAVVLYCRTSNLYRAKQDSHQNEISCLDAASLEDEHESKPACDCSCIVTVNSERTREQPMN